jgi:hypothetical protein
MTSKPEKENPINTTTLQTSQAAAKNKAKFLALAPIKAPLKLTTSRKTY